MKTRVKTFIFLMALFAAALSVGRLYFLAKYSDIYSGSGPGAIALSLLNGLRFDLATAAMASAPVYLLLFFPGIARLKKAASLLLYILLFIYLGLIIYDFIDIQYYSFAQRHLTFEVGNAWQDTDALVMIGLNRYILEVVALFAFMAVFTFLFLRAAKGIRGKEAGQKRWFVWLVKDAVFFLAAVTLLVVSIRGGVQMKPLGVKNAFLDDRVELGVLSLNGIYTTVNTFWDSNGGQAVANTLAAVKDDGGKDNPLRLKDEKTEAEAAPGFPLYKRFKKDGSEKKMNVVIFIMESWTAKYVGALGGTIDAAPEFTKLSSKGLLLTNCYANAQRSFEGVSAILASLPSWSGASLGKGGLLYQTRLEPLGSVLKKKGYETIFVHGAKPGSMGLDGLANKTGLDRHITREDFADLANVDDGVWGIYDEHAFLRAHEEFEKSEKPFFGVVYSLTSHTPYKVPSKEFEHFKEDAGPHDFLNSMRYSDWALGKFFEKALKSKYAKDTLFVILADHTEGNSTQDSLRDSYRIPCMFFAPGVVSPGRFDGVASQVDMTPTVIDILGLKEPYTSWGRSVLKGGSGRALLPRGDMVVWVDRSNMFLTDLASLNALYAIDSPEEKQQKADGASEPAMAEKKGELLKYLKLSQELIKENRVMPMEH